MSSELQKRLDELKGEFEQGQNELRKLEAQQTQLTETMLRISGAIMVLEELLARDGDAPDGSTEPSADDSPEG
jgi:predicted nuclease with TOPRIM domain